jgi:hypothetical protein
MAPTTCTVCSNVNVMTGMCTTWSGKTSAGNATVKLVGFLSGKSTLHRKISKLRIGLWRSTVQECICATEKSITPSTALEKRCRLDEQLPGGFSRFWLPTVLLEQPE